MKYSVRKARLEDMPRLLEFEQGIIEFERPFDPTLKSEKINYYNIKKMITAADVEVLVVAYEDELVASGYAKIMTAKPYLNHERYAYLGYMFVDKNHRGKGVNKMIIDQLLIWCKDQGLAEVRLDVYDDNPGAIRAYEKVGFKRHLVNMRIGLGEE